MGKTKVTIPIGAVKNGGNLYVLIDDLTNLNSQVSRGRDVTGTNIIIDDFNANVQQEIELDESVILSILAEGGEIEDHLFAIKQPSSSASVNVPPGVPSRLFMLGAVRNFSEWFATNADLWINNVTNEFIYYVSPNPSDGLILKGSEAEIIRQLDVTKYSFLTIAEVQTLVLDTNWVKQ